MDDEPQSWQRIVAELQSRLAAKKYPTKLWWVFREDILEFNDCAFVLCRRPRAENSGLAEKVYKRGHSLGFVRIVALARVFNRTVATVWYPDVAEPELQTWGKGAWIKIRKPLRRGILIPKLLWLIVKWSATYRSFQSNGWTIATRRWALQTTQMKPVKVAS